MLAFYEKLGFTAKSHGPFHSVHLSDSKINFHAPEAWQSSSFDLRGPTARPGCGDFCFVWDGSVDEIVAKLGELGIQIIEGPVERAGGRAMGTSVYVRDPDQNLLEFIVY